MPYLTKTPLEGSPAEVRGVLDELGRAGPAGGYEAGEHLRELAVALVRDSGLRVFALTYHDEPWELEVIPSGDPRCGLITVSRSDSGLHCELGWSRWAAVGSAADVRDTAGLMTAILKTSAVTDNREVEMTSNNHEPRVYRGLAASFRADIKNGRLAPGEKMPSITALCVEHGISRRTGGHAMQMLEDEKLIYRVPGLGYYVSG